MENAMNLVVGATGILGSAVAGALLATVTFGGEGELLESTRVPIEISL